MSRVLMLVEGSTERAIVEHVFAPVLGGKGLFLFPRVVGKPGHKGGNKFATVRRELKALYYQEPNSIVTMLFDYYGLHDDWPGLTEAKGKNPYEIPGLIESPHHPNGFNVCFPGTEREAVSMRMLTELRNVSAWKESVGSVHISMNGLRNLSNW